MSKFGTGVGTRISVIGDRATFSAIGKRGRFRGSWWCTGVEKMRISLGYVNGLEPYLDGRLMSGRDKKGKLDPKGVPMLEIKPSLFSKEGWSWICVRALVDAGGKIRTKDHTAEDLRIIQSDVRISDDELVGLFPVAVLRAREDGVVTMRQIAYFDLQHGTRKPEAGRRQHFFWPA